MVHRWWYRNIRKVLENLYFRRCIAITFGEKFWPLKPYTYGCCWLAIENTCRYCPFKFCKLIWCLKKNTKRSFGCFQRKFIVGEPTALMERVRLLGSMNPHSTEECSSIIDRRCLSVLWRLITNRIRKNAIGSLMDVALTPTDSVRQCSFVINGDSWTLTEC